MFQKYIYKRPELCSECSTASTPRIPLPLPYHTKCYLFVLHQHIKVASN